MNISSRLKNSLHTWASLVLIVVLAFLSYRYTAQLDITLSSSNTLSVASQKIVEALPDKIQITAYIRKDVNIRRLYEQLVDRYRYYKADINLTFVDPATVPDTVRELNLGSDGGIIIEYQGRTERLIYLDENVFTNALLQLANADERWVSFLTGHGERAPEGIANSDLGTFGKTLAQHKIRAQSLNLASVQAIPDNTSLLVVSAPAVPIMDGELNLINQYINKGGNLLILTDPNNAQLAPIMDKFGIHALTGTLVDGNSKLYNITDPSFVLVSEYIKHPIIKGFLNITVFPTVAALEADASDLYKATAFLSSSKQSWTETSPVTGKIRFDAGTDEKAGPLNFAYALTRKINKDTEQRIAVIGDGDFISNTYIGNVGNLDMGLRIINWLIHDDKFIDIPAKTAPDGSLQLGNTAVGIISLLFLIILPLGLLITGFVVWRRRNRR